MLRGRIIKPALYRGEGTTLVKVIQASWLIGPGHFKCQLKVVGVTRINLNFARIEVASNKPQPHSALRVGISPHRARSRAEIMGKRLHASRMLAIQYRRIEVKVGAGDRT